MRLFLIRHGEPEASARGRCYGKLDVGLSEAGRQSIEAVASAVPQPDAVYTSPRRRAVESARLLARPHGREPIIDERLAEIDFGELEGLTYDEARARHPDVYAAWMSRPTEVTFPGGESFARMRERVLDAYAEIRERHGAGSGAVCLVSHGGVNRILLAEALGAPRENLFRIGQAYGSLSIIDHVEGTPVVSLLNREPGT